MLTWNEFSAVRPDVAEEAARMLYEHGVGIGFLATTRPDGGPRVHPICPVLAVGLYGFILQSPKLEDLRRDPRYALHSETFPPPHHDDGLYLTGTVEELEAPDLRETLTEQFLSERNLTEPWPGFETQSLVEFKVDTVLLTLTEPRGGFPAGHTIWRAGAADTRP